jgi:hypothetical protein
MVEVRDSAGGPQRHQPTQASSQGLLRGQAAVLRWLDNLTEGADLELTECAVSDLLAVGELARSGAPEPLLVAAVGRARGSGWSWAPIALLAGVSRRDARRRFVTAITE